MQKKTFKEKLLFEGRKLMISLKRNYYIVPLILTVLCCFYFVCNLHIISSGANRVNPNYGSYHAMFVFIITLLSILAIVCYLNYALIKYGQKRPIYMLILYYLMTAINIVLIIMVLNGVSQQASYDYASWQVQLKENPTLADSTYANYLSCVNTKSILIATIVIIGITLVVVSTAPLVQAALNKLRFKRIENNESK